MHQIISPRPIEEGPMDLHREVELVFSLFLGAQGALHELAAGEDLSLRLSKAMRLLLAERGGLPALQRLRASCDRILGALGGALRELTGAADLDARIVRACKPLLEEPGLEVLSPKLCRKLEAAIDPHLVDEYRYAGASELVEHLVGLARTAERAKVLLELIPGSSSVEA